MPRRKKRRVGEGPVLIKRYGNRRLYNTETRSYVTFADIVGLIRQGRDIEVIDSKTGEDITRLILTQIILEEEKNKKSILPLSFLYQVIRAQEESIQDFFRNYLTASLEAYMKTKKEFDRRFRSWLEMSAMAPQMWERFFPGPEMIESFLDQRPEGRDEDESSD
ncbi:MAG: polyhydroxyalkanoate synthesis repressor PhaR [Acidobacteria bacterium]|nr:MAG: polyhydroxyalkanoate synthesis repressor PhaR [Acidobacteriota bacterium]